MRKILFTALAAAGMLASAGTATATVVDFAGLPNGDAANPLTISGATFTTAGGFNVIVTFGSESLCPSAVSNNPSVCALDLDVSFAAPSSGISFGFSANNQTTVGADIGDVQLFSGVTLLGVVDVIVLDGNLGTFDLVDLSAFSNVTRLLISSTDFGGVVYDDFTFVPSSLAVPEPATWALLL